MDDTNPQPRDRRGQLDAGGSVLTARVRLTYVFDSQCPWSHAVTPTVQALTSSQPDARIDVVHGRLFQAAGPLAGVAWYAPTASAVDGLTGARFGRAFVTGVADGTVTADSDTAAAAFVAMRAVAPDLALDIAAALHTALFVDGRSLNDIDTALDVATSLGLSADRVWALLGNPLVGRVAQVEQARAVHLGVDVYPALFVAAGAADVRLTTRLRSPEQLAAAIAETCA